MKKIVITLVLLACACAATLYLSPAAQWLSIEQIERLRAGLHEREQVIDDLRFSYYEGGPQDAPTVLLVHGFAADKNSWLWFARPLTERYRVIVVDLPGFGESSSPHGSYDVGTQAERLASFIDALALRRVHLLGHSMGGHIAALYAARYPERLASLALMANAGVQAPQPSGFMQRLQRNESNPLLVENPQQYSELMNWLFVAPPQLPQSVHGYLAARAVERHAHYQRIFSHLQQRYLPLEPELPRIQAPTLLLWGDSDRILDRSSIDVMRPLLHDARAVILKDCGHAPMLERPEQSAGHYLAFLDDVVRAAAAQKAAAPAN